jgi:plastocyanin
MVLQMATMKFNRRTALKAAGAGALSFGVFGSVAAAEEHCGLDPCTEAWLLSDPPNREEGPQWDGETIVNNKPLVKVGAGVKVTAPDFGLDEEVIPVAFDPLVTCVREGTTVRWNWLNQKSVVDVPFTVLHNVILFQFKDEANDDTNETECDLTDIEDLDGHVENIVNSGEPVGLNPPDAKDPIHFEHTFEEPGVYPYYCEEHGWPNTFPNPGDEENDGNLDDLGPNFGMRGAIIVK